MSASYDRFLACNLKTTPSLLYDGHLHGFDDRLSGMKSGILEYLQPGVLSSAGISQLEALRDHRLPVVVALCPQGRHTWQCPEGCATDRLFDALEEVNYCTTICGSTLKGDTRHAFSNNIVMITQGMLVNGNCLKLDFNFH